MDAKSTHAAICVLMLCSIQLLSVQSLSYTIRVAVNDELNTVQLDTANSSDNIDILIQTPDFSVATNCTGDGSCHRTIENGTSLLHEIIFDEVVFLDWNDLGGPRLLLNGVLLDVAGVAKAVLLQNADKTFLGKEFKGMDEQHADEIIDEQEHILLVDRDVDTSLYEDLITSAFSSHRVIPLSSSSGGGQVQRVTEFQLEWGAYGEWASSNLHVLASNPNNTQSDVVQVYKRWAASYDEEMMSSNLRSYKSVVGELALTMGTSPEKFFAVNTPKMLDVGCGTGLLGAHLRQLFSASNFELHGVDISTDMLEIASATKAYDYLSESDVLTVIPYFRDTFDIVLSSGLFFLGSAHIGAMNEILRVLKPNGLLVITMRGSYFDYHEQALNDILLYNQFRMIKKVKKPYYNDYEAYVVVIS